MTALGDPQADGLGTADELLSVAERLFADRGVENTAVTHIVAGSSQKNRSAVHYHFGSRAGVLAAVLNRRLGPINARREALIDALSPIPSAVEIVHATIAPLGLVVIEEPWGADYLSILAQLTFHPALLGEREVDDELLSGIRRGRTRLAQTAPQVDPALLARRLGWLTDSVVFAMARWVRDTAPADRTALAMAALTQQLAAYGTAGLLAPDPAPETSP